ncbi:MAG TPA: RNA polymerase sigma factor [Nocardioides sp.]|jgi:RNA polymerase sigma-70 factor (ECF subfamily)|nr:RNA polymerase sigma factor [Nocardioides sp.]
MSGSDDTRWPRARAGDSDAFVEIYDDYRGRVHGHALRLLGDPHDAEDVTAVTFLHLWRRRDDVRMVNGSVLPWLLVTATRTASNLRRAVRRHRSLLDRLPRADTTRSAEELADEAGFAPELAAAVRRLRAADRALVGLVVLEGLPLAEAAEVVGVSARAAKTRMYRIRIQLREELHPSHRVPAEEPR